MKFGNICLIHQNVIFNEMPNQVEIETDADFMSFWDEIHQLRDDVKKSLEGLIKDKTIKSSLEAKVTLKASGEKLEFLKKGCIHRICRRNRRK